MTVYTIGHSNIALKRFVDLLRLHLIQLLVDTRSQPYSRYAPQFNRESLKTSLQHADIVYLYLGDQLGSGQGKPNITAPMGKSMQRFERAEVYRQGLAHLKQEAAERCTTIMCSEADYRKCHRYWLITRSLMSEKIEVHHMLHSGALDVADPRDFRPVPHQLDLFAFAEDTAGLERYAP